MNQKKILLPFLLLLSLSCAKLPSLVPVQIDNSPDIMERCFAPFLKGDWQFVHSLTISSLNHFSTRVIGITSIFPESNRIEALMMTAEGLVIFHAVDAGGTVTVKRVIPRLNSKKLTAGLMDDIRLVFLKPVGELGRVGRDRANALVCRFKRGDARVVDVVFRGANRWEINLYDINHNRLRTVLATIENGSGEVAVLDRIPRTIQLNSSDSTPYSIEMVLLERHLLPYKDVSPIPKRIPLINPTP